MHLIFISKNNEGALYIDNTTLKCDDKVEPGETYTWQVPARAGPSDTECITCTYYSHIDPTKDTNSSLVGPLIICRKVSRLGKRLNVQAGREAKTNSSVKARKSIPMYAPIDNLEAMNENISGA